MLVNFAWKVDWAIPLGILFLTAETGAQSMCVCPTSWISSVEECAVPLIDNCLPPFLPKCLCTNNGITQDSNNICSDRGQCVGNNYSAMLCSALKVSRQRHKCEATPRSTFPVAYTLRTVFLSELLWYKIHCVFGDPGFKEQNCRVDCLKRGATTM